MGVWGGTKKGKRAVKRLQQVIMGGGEYESTGTFCPSESSRINRFCWDSELAFPTLNLNPLIHFGALPTWQVFQVEERKQKGLKEKDNKGT